MEKKRTPILHMKAVLSEDKDMFVWVTPLGALAVLDGETPEGALESLCWATQIKYPEFEVHIHASEEK